MTMEYITVAGFVLAIFVAGVTVGKLVEKVERFISKKEDEEHRSEQKTTASSFPRTKKVVFSIKVV